LQTQDVGSWRRSAALRPTWIVGAGRVGNSFARRLLAHPEFGLLPVGYLDDAPLNPRHGDVPVLGSVGDIDAVVERYGISQVIITFSLATHEELLVLTERATTRVTSRSCRGCTRRQPRIAVRHLGASLPRPQAPDATRPQSA
jgi:FlaA1/EpsC-like NDP-sugar epimerase